MSVVANAINPVLTLDRMVETSIVNTLEEKKLLSILLLRIIVKRLALSEPRIYYPSKMHLL